jgi:hypothetical protein
MLLIKEVIIMIELLVALGVALGIGNANSNKTWAEASKREFNVPTVQAERLHPTPGDIFVKDAYHGYTDAK